MTCTRLLLFMLTIGILSITLPAHSAGPQVGACTVEGNSEALVLVLCPISSVEDDWITAGREACDGKESCNAWIWTDEAAVPASAPATDAELPKDLSGKAVAIWVSAAESLIGVNRVK